MDIFGPLSDNIVRCYDVVYRSLLCLEDIIFCLAWINFLDLALLVCFANNLQRE